jgi:hypothetical protein
LIGLAVGDALGAAVEFRRPGSFAPVTGYRSGGPHGLKAGEWTDDTSMALALADSMASAGWDLNDQAERYVQWWQTGKYSVNGRCFDIGITTRSALGDFTHIVVGSAEVSYLVFAGELPWKDFWLIFAGPTLVGNIVGGSFIFALISHAQIRSESGPPKESADQGQEPDPQKTRK